MSPSDGPRPAARRASSPESTAARPAPRTGANRQPDADGRTEARRRTSSTETPTALVAASALNPASPDDAGVTTEAPLPFDRASDPERPALDLLSLDLAAAGRRARSRKAQAMAAVPDMGFALALRGRLLQPAGAALPSFGPPGLVFEPAAARPEPRAADHDRRRLRLGVWAILGIGVLLLGGAAAAVAAGLLGAAPPNRAGEVSDATLLRGGGSQALAAGTTLAVGDEIRVGADGHATLLLGSSQARLAAGTDVKLNTLSASNVQIALLAGRVYDRVVLPAGGSYEVLTGPYAWTATGTAFDLDRTKVAGGGEQVVLLALEHSVGVAGPAANWQVPEGSAVTVVFDSPSADGVTVGPIPPADFSDPWLIGNAKTDEALGYPIGALAGVALAPNGTPAAVPSPSPAPTAGPSDTPGSTPEASPSPSLEPSPTSGPTSAPNPTPTPTTSPSPTPTPAPTPQPSLGLSLASCPGGVVLNWSRYAGSGFVRYVTLRDRSPSIPGTYNSSKVLSGSSTTSISTTSAVDPTVLNGFTYFYRTLALGVGNKVLQASSVESGLGFAQDVFNPAAVSGGVVIWSYDHSSSCFSEYRVLYSASSDPTAGNASGSILVTDRLQSNVAVPDASKFSSGDKIYFRVQVLRTTALGVFVVGETADPAPSYTYP
jgi:hypothetical protein